MVALPVDSLDTLFILFIKTRFGLRVFDRFWKCMLPTNRRLLTTIVKHWRTSSISNHKLGRSRFKHNLWLSFGKFFPISELIKINQMGKLFLTYSTVSLFDPSHLSPYAKLLSESSIEKRNAVWLFSLSSCVSKAHSVGNERPRVWMKLSQEVLILIEIHSEPEDTEVFSKKFLWLKTRPSVACWRRKPRSPFVPYFLLKSPETTQTHSQAWKLLDFGAQFYVVIHKSQVQN